MLRLISLLLISILTACAPYEKAGIENGCVIDAVGYQDAIKASRKFEGVRWSRVLVIEWQRGNLAGAHAVCVFEYSGRIMIYDADKGSWTLATDISLKESPDALAALWCGSVFKFYGAYFL